MEPNLVRSDDFEAFFDARRTALLDNITNVMGKQVVVGDTEELDEDPQQYELVREDSLTSSDEVLQPQAWDVANFMAQTR